MGTNGSIGVHAFGGHGNEVVKDAGDTDCVCVVHARTSHFDRFASEGCALAQPTSRDLLRGCARSAHPTSRDLLWGVKTRLGRESRCG